MTDEEKKYIETGKRLLKKTPMLSRILQYYVKEVNEYSEEEVRSFINNISLSDSLIVKQEGPKLKYDVKCDLDIPHKGRVKVYIYIYTREEIEDIDFLTTINKLIVLLDLMDSHEDDGYEVLSNYSIWIIKSKEGLPERVIVC